MAPAGQARAARRRGGELGGGGGERGRRWRGGRRTAARGAGGGGGRAALGFWGLGLLGPRASGAQLIKPRAKCPSRTRPGKSVRIFFKYFDALKNDPKKY